MPNLEYRGVVPTLCKRAQEDALAKLGDSEPIAAEQLPSMYSYPVGDNAYRASTNVQEAIFYTLAAVLAELKNIRELLERLTDS